ncbi:MAG: sulfatase [Akkermansiaceae bacterium]|nr:sulfatase [Akkermansiaceae bacterium]
MKTIPSILTLLISLCPLLHAESKPNFIIIFADDQGYNDLGCFGSETIKTPHIDKMAEEGRKFTSFYVGSSVCTPSRAALLTGSYPKRLSMARGVIFPNNDYGLHPDEVTIADMLKQSGYATACVGKWHLGHEETLLPTKQGFDSYYGIPYSNDMNHPRKKGEKKNGKKIPRRDESWKDQEAAWQAWNTPLMQGEEIIELPVNQRTITRRYTDKAIEFITANKEQPFFLYLAHTMPHVPLFVPEDAYDPDPANAYKCVIEHMDAETGRILEAVKELGLSDNTYVIYTSDNGPWLKYDNHGGSAKPLRDGKMTTYEGGQRVPTVMWAPGRIPAGTETDEMASTLDLLPTIAKLSGSELKPRGPIDGLDISDLIHGADESPRSEFLYYSMRGALSAIRQGDWKLRLHKSKNTAATTELYNLAEDIGEQNNLAEKYPEKVETLTQRMRELDGEIGKGVRKRGSHKKLVKQ